MNNLDKQYQSLLQDILDNGVEKKDRTGTGTISVFGRQIRHKMSEGFPLLTTKKMHWKSIVTELLWFLRGDTNIKYLVDNNCHIWDGDAYKNYIKDCVLFDEISNSRMTRTIIGCPSSTDITSYINPESDWGAIDYLTGEKIKYEDCDNGVIYFNQKMVKISSLKQIGVTGLRCESLHRSLDESNFIYNKEEFINKIKTDDEFAKTWGELGPVYGKQWRGWGRKNVTNYDLKDVKGSDQPKVLQAIKNGEDVTKYGVKIEYQNNSIDQIANLINELKTNPDSRRLMVSAWNVGELDQMVLPPCHYGFQVYTRELSFNERIKQIVNSLKSNAPLLMEEDEKTIEWLNNNNVPTRAISLMWNQRSVDTFLGLPFNIASYGLLLEIIAKEVNMVPDELIGNLGDVHLYSNHVEQAKEQIGRELTIEERVDLIPKGVLSQESVEYFNLNKRINTEIMVALAKYFIRPNLHTREPYPLPTLKIEDGFDIVSGLDDIYEINSFTLENYQSHPTIKAPLSN